MVVQARQIVHNHLMGGWGKVIGGVRLNHLSQGKGIYHKRRYPYSDLLIWGANRFLRPPFQPLPENLWLAWEPVVYQAIYGLKVRQRGRVLDLPALPGTVLADYLLTAPQALKLQAVRAAVVALQQLHQHTLEIPGGPTRLFSHADATVRNVLYDPLKNQACWFDFETVHPPGWAADQRQADDLGVLADSMAVHLPESLWPQLAGLIATTYTDSRVCQTLAKRLTHFVKPTAFRLAQVNLKPAQRQRWYALLLAELHQVSPPGDNARN